MRSPRPAVTAAASAAAAAVLLFIACRDDATAPGHGGLNPDVEVPDTGAVTLRYMCGNSFSLRNAGTTSVPLAYTVSVPLAGTDTTGDGIPDTARDSVVERGAVTLPPRPGDADSSETFLTTTRTGAVRLYADTTLVREAPNGGTACPDRARIGAWTAPFPWPVVAVHMHVLPDGTVLTWGNKGDPQLWDPTTGTFTSLPSETHLFCSGHSFLPDGRILITGGHISNDHGLPDVNIFDPVARTWTRAASMARGRWYPTNTTLPNGEVLTIAGRDQDGLEVTVPEVWTTNGTWRRLTTASKTLPYYPRTFVAPNGRVFYAGEARPARYLNTSGTGTWSSTYYQTNYQYPRDYGSAVMYETGKILIVGGYGRLSTSQPTATAEVIDLNKSTPAWRNVGSMAYRRRQINATILPTGTVLVTGGTSSPGFNNPARAVYVPELWDPKTGQWTKMAKYAVMRIYHSTAALLPDGRVLSAGGGDTDNGTAVDQLTGELFSPPYLFKPDGSPADRPTVTAAPARVGYGAAFFVETPDGASIRSARWIRLASVTHAFDENQRANTLPVAPAEGGVTVTAPANRNLAPPGHYVLFLIDHNGTPSVGKVVQVN